jgi:hypothetical protein
MIAKVERLHKRMDPSKARQSTQQIRSRFILGPSLIRGKH